MNMCNSVYVAISVIYALSFLNFHKNKNAHLVHNGDIWQLTSPLMENILIKENEEISNINKMFLYCNCVSSDLDAVKTPGKYFIE